MTKPAIDRRTLPSAESLSRKFAASMLEDLGAEVLADCVAFNKTPEYADCCATHNCRDANMVMLDAVESFGFDADDLFANDCENPLQARFNEAWDLAKANGFYL